MLLVHWLIGSFVIGSLIIGSLVKDAACTQGIPLGEDGSWKIVKDIPHLISR